MTIPATTRVSPIYQGNASATVFAFSYKTYAKQELQVIVSDGVTPQTLVLDSDYSVALNLDQINTPGGTVTYPIVGSPLAVGLTLVVVSNVPNSQDVSLPTGGAFNAASVELGFDRQEVQLQQFNDTLNRTIRVPVGESISAPLPAALTRANYLLGFDGMGNPVAVAPTSGSATALATDLTSTAVATKGSGQIGFLYSLAYPVGTVGRWLKDLATSAGSSLIGFIAAGGAAILRTVQSKLRDFVSVKDYGAKGDGSTDDTAAINAALSAAGEGSTVWFPPGIYIVNGTLTRQPGQTLRGAGWRDTPLTFQCRPGSTEIRQMTAGLALISSSAASDAVNAGRGGLRDIALTFRGGSDTTTGDTTSTGFYAMNSRQLCLDNVFISGFGTGYELANNCWQCRLDGVMVFDAVTCAFTHDAGGEDSTHVNCIYRGYRATSKGLSLKNQVQRVTMIGCDTSNNQLGIKMEQGDTNGDGTGTPYAMGLTNIGGQFESCTVAAVQSISSVTSAVASVIALFPSITILDPRAFNSTSPNTGQIMIDAQKASRVELTGCTSTGYSVGVQIGMSGTVAQLVEVHVNNPQSVWGTSEVAAAFANAFAKVFRRTGPRPSATFTSTALTTATPANIPFSTVVSDVESWYFLNGSTPSIRPKRTGRMKIGGSLRWSTMPAGHLVIDIYKNAVRLATVYEATVVSAALSMYVEWEDVAATGDSYYLVVTPPGSCTLDTTSSTFFAEACL